MPREAGSGDEELKVVIIGLTVVLGLTTLCPFVSSGDTSNVQRNAVWSADNGDGTYKNPIIYADYSDPDVIRVENDFYLVASSFDCSPGLPVLHSKDLVNWTIIGHAFQRYPYESFNTPQHGNGVWAPSIRYHNGEFYIYFGDPDLGIFMTKARNPAGPWEPLVHFKAAKGWIDTCPFWDDDGNAYLVHAWARSRAGINSVLTINRMSPDGKKLLDEGRLVFDGHANHPTIEGPKLYKRDGYYYIFAPAGGVATGWQTVLRSKNIFGPYEDRIVMDQGRTNINGPHQGGWVELKSGESWFIHFQDRGAYGRIVHLQPMKWIDDWPVIGVDPDGDGKGEPVLTHKKPNVGRNYPVAVPQTSDEFTSKSRGFQWQWQANYLERWMSLSARPGWLRLFPMPASENAGNLWLVPNLLLQKLPAEEFTVTTKLDSSQLAPGEKGGLIMFGIDYSFLAVEKTESGLRLIKMVCKNANAEGKEVTESQTQLATANVLLRVKIARGGVCQFSFSEDGKTFANIGEPFTAREGRWVGAKVGLFALAKFGAPQRGYADFDWFRFE
jgi:beta-xylosidase